VKKGITINKDVFKRASSTKETREFSISERTKSANKYQAAADFVASQKRTSNTKGQESELSKDWDRFSDKGSSSSIAKLATKSNIQDKPKQRKLTPAQRAQVEAHMRAQKKALTPASILMTSEASSDSPADSNLKLEGLKPSGLGSARLLGEEGSDTGAGNAAMGHQAGAKAGSASLEDGATAAVDAGNANMGHQAGAKAGSASLEGGATADVNAGNANMGHKAGAKAGSASLEGGATADADAGNANMGHHADAKAGSASLEGGATADVDAGNANMGHHADAKAGNATMGHQADAKSGSASLKGGATAEVDAGNAHMGHRADAKAGAANLDGKKIRAAGQADMGHHVGGRVISASLDGEDVDGAAGQVNMGHQGSKQAGEKSLEGRNHKAALSTTLGNTEAPKAAKNEKPVLSSRLAEKMSKIRAQSADITMDSDALQERNDKP
jgi:hypothetical protein